MKKNILIIGASRTGKTTLSQRLHKTLGYNIINLDNIICGIEDAFPKLGIKHDYNDRKTATRFAPFLNKYLKELSEGPAFYNDNQYVIEGVYIDFEKVLPNIDKEKYEIIGLTYNDITSEKLFEDIKSNDTEDDWTYYVNDNELKEDANYFIECNKYFDQKFKEHNIKTYDVSIDRNNVFEKVVEDMRKEQN